MCVYIFSFWHIIFIISLLLYYVIYLHQKTVNQLYNKRKKKWHHIINYGYNSLDVWTVNFLRNRWHKMFHISLNKQFLLNHINEVKRRLLKNILHNKNKNASWNQHRKAHDILFVSSMLSTNISTTWQCFHSIVNGYLHAENNLFKPTHLWYIYLCIWKINNNNRNSNNNNNVALTTNNYNAIDHYNHYCYYYDITTHNYACIVVTAFSIIMSTLTFCITTWKNIHSISGLQQ